MDVKWYMKCFIYWTADLKSSKPWSSQFRTQFKQLCREAWKSQDFNGVWTCHLVIPVQRSNQLSYHGLLDFRSAVQYMKHFIYHFTSILHWLIRTHKWPAPNVSGFIAQLVRASHRCRTGVALVDKMTASSWHFRSVCEEDLLALWFLWLDTVHSGCSLVNYHLIEISSS